MASEGHQGNVDSPGHWLLKFVCMRLITAFVSYLSTCIFNDRFPGEPRLADSSLFFFHLLVQKRSFGRVVEVFRSWISLLVSS